MTVLWLNGEDALNTMRGYLIGAEKRLPASCFFDDETRWKNLCSDLSTLLELVCIVRGKSRANSALTWESFTLHPPCEVTLQQGRREQTGLSGK